MTRYRRIDNEELASHTDLVVVGIAPGPEQSAPPTATITWRGGAGGGDGPYDVEKALALAEEVRRREGLSEVAISIGSVSDWSPIWGELTDFL